MFQLIAHIIIYFLFLNTPPTFFSAHGGFLQEEFSYKDVIYDGMLSKMCLNEVNLQHYVLKHC